MPRRLLDLPKTPSPDRVNDQTSAHNIDLQLARQLKTGALKYTCLVRVRIWWSGLQRRIAH